MPVDPETRIYTYDSIGNRKTAEEHTLLRTYSANSLNQYDQITTGTETETPAYDDDGNMTAYKGRKNTYNAENRLTVSEPENPVAGDKKVEFVYDYMGRRVKKTVSVWEGSWTPEAEKLFIYDGWNMICEITVPESQPATEKYFVWGLDLSQSLQGAGGIGGLVAALDKHTGIVYYYLYDANGNVGQLVNADDGSIAAHYEYDPYGNTTHKYGTEADNNVYMFSTKFFDIETGLYYYGFRYFSTELGRWITRDPIEEDGGINLYNFIFNNVLDSYDPLGLAYPFGEHHGGDVDAYMKDITPPSIQLSPEVEALLLITGGLSQVVAGLGLIGGGGAAEVPSLGSSTFAVVVGYVLLAQGGNNMIEGGVHLYNTMFKGEVYRLNILRTAAEFYGETFGEFFGGKAGRIKGKDCGTFIYYSIEVATGLYALKKDMPTAIGNLKELYKKSSMTYLYARNGTLVRTANIKIVRINLAKAVGIGTMVTHDSLQIYSAHGQMDYSSAQSSTKPTNTESVATDLKKSHDESMNHQIKELAGIPNKKPIVRKIPHKYPKFPKVRRRY